MKSIATLGPKETFSDLATQAYIKEQQDPFQVQYYPTLKTAFQAIGTECDYGVLPIENLSEGYVQIVLDLLMDTDLYILDEILLPITFAFVANRESFAQVEQIFVQFVAHGQCSEFLERQSHVEIKNTQSNMESLALLNEARTGAGAVIPQHALLNSKDYPFVLENVTDYANNQTRFLVLGKSSGIKVANASYKTSLVVRDDLDKPGVLGSIITAFTNRGINMTSIMSRPTKAQLGKYHFFIDIEGHREQREIDDALAEICLSYAVKVLGSYPLASNYGVV